MHHPANRQRRRPAVGDDRRKTSPPDPVEVRVRRVHHNGMYVRVSTVGEPDAGTHADADVASDPPGGRTRPFILVPGIGVSSTYFERLAPRLNEFGPVHALDLPGFGGVPHPDHALEISEYADLVGAVIEKLELDDPVIVGHSMGSQIVSDLAARTPELTTLVLIGPVVHPRHRRIPVQAVNFLRAALHEPMTVKVLAVSNYIVCGYKWFSRILPKMMAYPIEDRLPEITAHTLVIRGEYDAVAPRDWVERAGELLPSSKLWEIPGAAHSVMYAHAEEVARLCVIHARETQQTPDDDVLHVDPDDHEDANPPSLRQMLRALRGQAKETVGSVRGDDDLIEEGKSETAQAIDAAQDEERPGVE